MKNVLLEENDCTPEQNRKISCKTEELETCNRNLIYFTINWVLPIKTKLLS
jgi:hypothetical protein